LGRINQTFPIAEKVSLIREKGFVRKDLSMAVSWEFDRWDEVDE
jgi:hypothetical protein